MASSKFTDKLGDGYAGKYVMTLKFSFQYGQTLILCWLALSQLLHRAQVAIFSDIIGLFSNVFDLVIVNAPFITLPGLPNSVAEPSLDS